ncbi:MAG: DUF5724 domain-containing protein [Nocardioides sp.]
MLSGEAAREALAAYRGSEASRAKDVRVHGLLAPALARDIAAAVQNNEVPWRPVAEQLDQLSLAKREKVLRAITPELGSALAQWWGWSVQQPYQRGWQRRAYRSSDPVDSRAARWHELSVLLRHSVHYPQPVEWQAAWAMHVGEYVPLGPLFASAIAAGNTEVSTVLRASIRGEHDISGPSQSAYVGLLAAPDAEGWADVERLLVAAQRSEGLRQTILEAADLAHPDAFARILDLAVTHGLARFAGTVRAVGTWIGEDLSVRQEKQVAHALATIRDHLAQPPGSADLAAADPVDAFLGLWSLAVRDAHAAAAAATGLQSSADERTRLAAARVLGDLAIPAVGEMLLPSVRDDSEAVSAAAVEAWPADAYRLLHGGSIAVQLPDGVHATLLERVRSKVKEHEVETGLIGTRPRRVGATVAADIVISNSGGRPLDLAVVMESSANARWAAAQFYSREPQVHRAALFTLLVDRSQMVRDAARGALASLPAITEAEAHLLETALSRKVSDLRQTALALLRVQEPTAIAASVARLAAGTADQKRAADELAAENKPQGDATLDVPPAIAFTPADRTPAVRPPGVPDSYWQPYHDRCRLLWTSLGAWLSEHSGVEVQTYGGVELLANLRWLSPQPDNQFPLPELLEPWWERIEPRLTDGGLELALLASVADARSRWQTELARRIVGPVAKDLSRKDVQFVQGQVIEAVASWARRDSWAEPLVCLAETAAAHLPLETLAGPDEVLARRGRKQQRDQWGQVAGVDGRDAFSAPFTRGYLELAALSEDQLGRLWRALRFLDEPEGTLDRWGGPMVEVVERNYSGPVGTVLVPDQPFRLETPTALVVEAFTRGHATDADLMDALIASPTRGGRHFFGGRSDAASQLTALRLPSWADNDRVREVVDRVRTACVESEVTRGDLPVLLSTTAATLRTTYGAEHLLACVAALGRRPFVRGYSWTKSRESSLSRLVRVNQPLPGDTAAELGERARALKISDGRLVETAVYAPQWARLIEQHLGWEGFESAVWWVHAHTKDDSWSVDAEVRAQWATEVSQRTPLDAVDLVKGGADVAWFHSIIETLGEVRFVQVLTAAKYASSSGGHKRAELFAAALLGKADEGEVRERIRAKRHQDSVRALGLLPLADQAQLLDRYELMRAFVASDRTSGSQRRASESTAVEVGLENLARTAGFRDPQRLVWAMEAEAVRDLVAGPIAAHDGDLTVTLAIDAAGAPELTVERAGKPLKSVPAKSAKVPEIAELRERLTSLRKQTARMRSSLESACVLGDAFEPQELADLLGHPILAPMLRDIVLVDAEGVLGFPGQGSDLIGPDGGDRAAYGPLRIAHPTDLLASAEWPEFQHDAMVRKLRQPFKQLFRELYTLNGNEADEGGLASRRYAGHQVEARRAAGLFTSRGWVADFEQGFSRTFHQQKITAWCQSLNGWGSPTEVEDATVDDVTFHPAGAWAPLPLAEVPPRVFSETMRDLDLVVSVAHAGGVDPEASESSVEMRGRLVEETTSLLGRTNVEVAGHHVRIKGTLGSYSVHLGSGVVHRIPGNAVCIVPVSAQHRGRIFLPFADDDPRTAEIVAKVVLLARDDQIKDPTILAQLVR